MAVYVTEEELREEIFNIQQSYKLNNLLALPELTEDDKIEIENLRNNGVPEKYSKEAFGNMILMIVQKLAKKGNFAGYTWQEDFYSNAIEKILTYATTNADLNMVSRVSGERTKIFAYISQIASNAFIEVINERKQEQADMMEHIIPFEDFYSQVKK